MPSNRSPRRRYRRCTNLAKARVSRLWNTHRESHQTTEATEIPTPAASRLSRSQLGLSHRRSEKKRTRYEPNNPAAARHTAIAVSTRHSRRSTKVNC